MEMMMKKQQQQQMEPRPSLQSNTLDIASQQAAITANLLAASQSLEKPISSQQQSRLSKHTELKRKLKDDVRDMLKQEAMKMANGLTYTSIPVQQNLCMNMLSFGKPKAFIGKVLSSTHMSDLSKSLVESELATRKGDVGKLCEINYVIANIFEESQDYHKAVYYFSRSVSTAKQAGNFAHEAKGKFSLGKVYVKLGQYPIAMSLFEECLDFARESKDNNILMLGSKHLLEVYQLSAKKARYSGDLEKSIELLHKSIQMAEICDNIRAKAEAKHEIGLLQQKLSRFDLALPFHTDYLQFCILEKDEVGQSKAYGALAKTHEHIGNIELAIQHLESLLDVAKYVNKETEAIACCKLGMMYKNQSLYEKALSYFEMFFKLSCSLGNQSLIDAARLNLAYVKRLHTNEPQISNDV